MLFIGLMSGTSLDGVDAVLADCSPAPPKSLTHAYRAFPDDLRATLTALCASGPDELERCGVAARELVLLYAAVVGDLLKMAEVSRSAVRAIGAHGQTVRHRPQLGFSVQLNAPALLAELTQIDVVADFRSRDIAAGGHGAPLASIFHVAAFSGPQPRAVVNIGGISNLTGLPRAGGDGSVIGFDTGPGNLLLDYWVQKHFAQPFDRNGALAASAGTDQPLLDALLAEPFFAALPPKSSGRELFSPAWLERVTENRKAKPAIVLATLTKLTAAAIGRAVNTWFPQAADVVVCGGGARNETLLRMLEAECAPRPVFPSSALGVEPDQVEALAFAWLASAHVNSQAGNVPSVTGARGSRILGGLYPAREPA
ncbi:MAG TPA: anhydro-N-acetylmuramic acid kinase [Burkholderiaceae bacterium]|nr:anhydro-N-acetylmuramic acid kinase [Burkholderiaceae bacterium]